jgi:acyl-CoA synthetase (NDP forming)
VTGRERVEGALKRAIGTHRRAIALYEELGRDDRAELERARSAEAEQKLAEVRKARRVDLS